MEDILKEEVIKLEGELTKLKTAVEYIETAKISIESASKIINTIVELKKDFDVLSGKIYSLIDKLNKVDFPTRLDRIDSNILKVSTEIQDIKSWIETRDKALTMEMKALSRNLVSQTNENKNKILIRLDKQSREIKTNRLEIMIAIIFIVALGVLFYLNIL
jgi:paraquat-inducible protein B